MPERFLIVKKYLWARVGLFAVAAVAVYGWSALHNGFVGYDDPRLIIDNPLIRTPGPSTWATIFTTYEAVLYVPLLFISYQIDFLLGGLTPAVYHIHNLTLHTVTAFLVSVLLFQLTGRRVAAVLCGMLFLVHPLNTEVVAWASARKDALMGLFAVLSVVAYLHGQKNHDQRWYIVSVLSFALALLSKPAAIALPIALPILNHIAGRPFISKKSGIQLLPFLILSLAAGIVGLTGSGQQLRMGSSPLSENGLLALKSMGVAIVKFIAPVKLSVIYPFTDPVTITSPHIFLPALFVGVLFVIAWLLRRKEPTILWGLLLFVLLLAPTWASFRIGEDFGDVYFMADRYVYLPMIGLLLVVATVLIRATDRFGPGIVRGIATVILVAFGIVASAQATVWYDSRALFSHVLRHYPNAQAAHVNIGVLDADEGLPLEAIESYQKALALRQTSNGFANLGQVYMDTSQYESAIAAFQAALEINPLNAPVQLNIGVADVQLKKYEEAITAFEQAAVLDPTSPIPFINIALVNEQLGQINAAITAAERAVALAPQAKNVQDLLKRLQNR